ncbi:MAG: ArsA-related P-loop ATPase, partial [Ilumatobacteraceae bacterium]
TVTAVLARAASRSSRRVLVVELDGKPTLAALLPGIEVMAMSAPDALDDYLREHGFGRVATRLSKTGVIDVVGTAAPGIDDIVVLGKIKQLERTGAYDLIVVDGPAAGHAITFLTAASGLADSVKGGPIRTQADEVLEMLHDPSRCQVVLVALPEATPVNEVIETAYALEDEVGVQLGPIVLNAVDELDTLPTPDEIDAALGGVPDVLGSDTASWLRAAAAFRRSRLDMQDDERRRLATEVPLTVLTLPDRHRAGLDASDIERLADRWAADGPLDTEPSPPDSAAPDPAPSEGGEPHSIDTMIAQASVIVCCGSGGVGKTTTAAAIGLRAAAAGRRVVVVTIDPAKRLADALGLVDGLAAAPQRIELTEDGGVDSDKAGVEGEMWAMMLDAEATFDDLVRREAGDDAQVDRILSNRFYRNIAGALSGTQEYMASEMLHQLHVDERFDLVVVDTPPSRNALDFLEAPGVLARFLDHRVFRLMMLPTKGGLRIIGTATQPILRAIGRVVGSDVLADSVAFFQAFAGMEAGFRERAAAVMALIRADATAFVIVTSPHHDTIDEAVWFADQLAVQGVGHEGAGAEIVIVNRVHPAFGPGTADEARAAADKAAADGDGVLAALWNNAADLRAARERELVVVGPLAEMMSAARLAFVPLLERDVHDLDGLQTIAGHLGDGDR